MGRPTFCCPAERTRDTHSAVQQNALTGAAKYLQTRSDQLVLHPVTGSSFEVALSAHRVRPRRVCLPVHHHGAHEFFPRRPRRAFAMEAETPEEIVGLADVGTPAVKAREDVNVIHASTWGTKNGLFIKDWGHGAIKPPCPR